MQLRKFEDHLYEKLRDTEYAAEYLEAAKEDGIDEFLHAVREVASAQEGGVKNVAKKAGLGRESMYKSLSKSGNPQLKTLDNILSVLGLQLCVTPLRTHHSAHDPSAASLRCRKGHFLVKTTSILDTTKR